MATSLLRRAALPALLLGLALPARAQSHTFHVTLDLTGRDGQTFTLNAFISDGSGVGNGNNSISSKNFPGVPGGPFTLTDASPGPNLFPSTVTGGGVLSFDITLTNNPEPDPSVHDVAGLSIIGGRPGGSVSFTLGGGPPTPTHDTRLPLRFAVTVIPEPSALALMAPALGPAALLLRRRRAGSRA